MDEVNRGLISIDDSMYQLLVSIEVEFRKHFTLGNTTTNESLKDLAFHGIIESENVQFIWTVISANWELEEATELLKLIATHYITIRGFSFAIAFVETFKQSNRKSTQKAKGLRKTL